MMIIKPLIKDVIELHAKLVLQKLPIEYPFTIVFRYGTKGIEKLIVKLDTLVRDVYGHFNYNERKRIPGTEFRSGDITSICILDAQNNVIYDSKQNLVGQDKLRLKKDKDIKVQMFKFLSEQDKEAVINVTVSQILTNISDDRSSSFMAPSGSIAEDKPKLNDPFAGLDFLK